jgi:hypothetical protein
MKWIVGVSLVAVIVGAFATMTIPAQTITPDQAVLKLFPAETQGVGFIDAAALRNTPLGQDLISQGLLRTSPPKLAEFAAATGFDFQHDVDRVTAGNLGNRRMLFVIEARYDKFKVERFLSDHVTRLETHMGRPIYEERDLEVGVAFIDNLVIAGYIEAVKTAIEQASLPASDVRLRSDLLATIRTFEAGNQVWGVGEFHFDELPITQLPPQAAQAEPILKLLRTLQGGTYRMRIDRDVHARGTANFADAENAKTLAGLARGMVALMKTQLPKENQDLLHALDGVQITNSGTQMIVTIEESGDLVKKLRELGPRRGLRLQRRNGD